MQSLKKVSLVGVIAGSIVSVAGRFLVSLVVGFFIGIQLAASGATMPANAVEAGFTNPYIVVITFLVMSLFSILGGYTAATIAKHDELLNGALSSFLAMLWAFCTLSTNPLFLVILTLITTPLLAALGGYLRTRQMRRKQSPLSGGRFETDIQRQGAQPEQTPVKRGNKSQQGKGEYYTLIRLGGIVLVIGIIWSLWFGWSLGAFVGPGVIILLGYGIFRLFRKGNPRPSDGHQE
jgi:hypothetical protein